MEEIRFKQFQYFIQCYLVMAENYSEVIKLSREFKETEHQQYIDKLLAEVTEIKTNQTLGYSTRICDKI